MSFVQPGPSRRTARSITVAVALAMLASLLATATGPVDDAAAQQYDPPAIRFQTNGRGDIDFVGNTLQTCPASSGSCTAAQNATISAANNSYSMVNVDQDGLGSNSSVATLTLPPDAEVLFAGLYWGAVSSAGSRNQASFKTPAQGYQTVTASTVDSDGGLNYQAFYDATAEVQAAGSGEYGVGNVAARTGGGRYAGWSMIVVYEDTSLPFRNLTVYDGYSRVNQANPVSITVDGFLTPVTGPVAAKVTQVVYEGDDRYTGDQMRFEGTVLGDGAHPSGNFFNSRISKDGMLFTDKSPNYVNQLGYDIARVDVTGLLANNQTSATIDYTSAGDWYYVGVVGTAIDIFVPDLDTALVKSVGDLNGGEVLPGDVIEYSISSENLGQDPAVNSNLFDPIPAGTTYVPGSLQIVDHPTLAGTAPTDSTADGDGGGFTGSSADFQLGTIDIGESFEVRFRVTVDPGTEFSTIANTATLEYQGATLPDVYTNEGSTSFDVEAAADLVLESKIDSIDPVTAGETFDYTVTVRNDGPSPSIAPVVTDPLPAGLIFVSGAGCSAGPPVSCTLPDIAAGGTQSVTITVQASPDAAAATVTNQVSVESPTTADPDVSNNQGSETTEIVRSADVSINKVDVTDPVNAGDDITYTLTIVNAGPSTSTDVTVSDVLPSGVTLMSATPDNGTTCSGSALVTCALGDLAPTATVNITVVVTSDFDLPAGTVLTNSASVTTTTPDPDPGNDSASETTDVGRVAALSVDKTGPATVNAGEIVSYTVTTTNAGPSISENAVVVDTLPAGFEFDPDTSTPGCTLTTPPSEVTCALGDLAPGAASAASVTISALVPSSTPPSTAVLNSATVTDDDANTATDDHAVDVTRAVDLNIAKSDSVDPVAAGDTLTYTIVVGNDGPSDASSVTVTDTLPPEVTFLSATFVPAEDGTCSGGPTVNCTPTDSTLAAGTTATIEIVVDVPAGLAPGTPLANSATVTSTEDPVGATAVQETGTYNAIDLTIGKVATPNPVIAGEDVTYTITFDNAGPSDATGALLVDSLPAELTFVSAEFVPVTDGTCTHDGLPTGGDVTCVPATLLAGQTVTVTIVATANADTPDGTDVVNTVTGSADDPANPGGTISETADATVNVQRQADLAVTKTASPDPVTAGQTVTYTIDIENFGPSDASGIVALDPLPLGLSVDTLPPGCVDNAGTISCDVGILAAGSATSVVLSATVDPSTPPGADLYPNTVTVTANEPDPTPDNNSSTVAVDVDSVVALGITKVDNVDPVTAGEQVIYSIEVTNAGPSDADNVEVSDTPPAGLTFDGGASTTGCVFTDPTIDCALGTLGPNESTTVNLAFTVDAATPAGTVTNTASVVSDEDPVGAQASQDTTIQAEADLAVVKSASPEPAVPGTDITYTIDVENNGPSTATAASVVDTLPGDVSFVSVDPAGLCTHDGSPAGGAVTCALGDLAPDATTTITIVATIDPASVGPVDNTATASSAVADPNPDNDTSSTSTPLLSQADVSLTKDDAPDPATAGLGLTYSLSAANAGPSTATNVVITDTLPPQVAFVSAPGCSHTGEAVGGTVTCSLGDLAPGANVPIVISVTVDSTTTAAIATNTASVATDSNDPDPLNNDATANTAIEAVADLSLSKSVAPNPVLAGEQATYTLIVSNAGPSSAQAVNINDQLPAGVSFVAANVVNGPATCTGAPGAGGTVACGFGTLDTGQSRTVEVVVDVLASATGTQTNSAVASSPTDPTPASATAPLTVQTSADLVMTDKSDNVDPAVAGQGLVWRLAIRNDGPSDAVDSTITDTLPAGVTFDPATSTAGCTFAGGTVTCPTGTLEPGETAAVDIGVTVDPATTGTIDNVGASTQSATDDPDPGNNSATESTAVATQSQVLMTKQSTPDPVVAGEQLAYEITIVNEGPSVAADAVFEDGLPTGTSFVSANSSQGAVCTEDSDVVTCELGDLAVGVPVTISIEVTTDSDLPAGHTVQNVAAVDWADGGPTVATASSDVVRSADIAVAKTDRQDPVPAGTDIVWDITVDNNGPSDASNIVVTDTLPPNTTFNPALSSAECSAMGASVICAIPAVEVGVPVALVVAATVDSLVAPDTVLSNSVSVEADEPDPTLGNNTDVELTTISQVNDLSIVKVDDPDPATAGEEIAWTVTVTNAGPSNASNIEFEDTLPPGVTFVPFTSPPPSGSDPACTEAAGVVTCTVPGVAAGDSVDVPILGAVDPSIPAATVLTNEVAITAFDGTDPNPDDNSDSEPTSVEREAGLVLSKTASPSPVIAGENLTFVLRLQNDGPSDASAVTLSDSVPTGTTFVSVTALGTGEPATCAQAAGSITCTPDAAGSVLAAGDFIEVEVVVTVDSDLGPGDQVQNTATGDALESDPVNGQSTTQVQRSADLSLVKQASPEPVLAGEQVTYTLTVVNNGPSAASGVVVDDVLPLGLTFASSPDGCTATGPSVQCAQAAGSELAVGTPLVFTVVADVAPNVADGAVLTNAAVVSATEPDPNAANDQSAVDTTVEREADLSITKTDGDVTAVAGETVSYTIEVTNDGPSVASDVSIADAVPAGTTFVAAASTTACSEAAGTVTCGAVTPLDVGETETFTVSFLLDDDILPGSTITNTATASAAETDPTPTNQAQDTTPTATSADVSIVKNAVDTIAVAGTTTTWSLEVVNDGPSVARNVVVTDSIQSGLSAVSATPAAECSTTPTTVTCTFAVVEVGERIGISIETEVDANRTTPVFNSASVSSDTPDPDTGNNQSADVELPVGLVSDLAVAKSSAPDPIVPGGPITYTIVVTNNGPSAVTGASLSDTTPAEAVEPTSSCQVDPTDGTCTETSIFPETSYDIDLAPGASATITIDATVDPAATMGFLNSATVTAPPGVSDPIPENNTDDDGNSGDPTVITDLSVTKSSSPSPATAGEAITYTIVVTNDGPSTAAGATLTDTLPTEITGPTATCDVDPDDGVCAVNIAGGILSGTYSLDPGASLTVEVDGTVAADVTGAISNIVDVAAAPGATDPDTGDNTATDIQTPLVSADLTVEKTPNSARVTAGETISWTVVVGNDGPSTATGVELSELVPSGLTLVSEPAGCTNGVCTIGTLAPGATRSFVFETAVDASVTDPIVNVAEVTSDVPDPDTTNNRDETDPVPVDVVTDLAVVKSSSPDPVVAGVAVQYTMVVTNNGPSTAVDAVVSDEVPSEVLNPVVSCDQVPAGGSCSVTDPSANSELLVSIPVGESVVIVIDGTVDPAFDGSIENTVAVTAGPGATDPSAANNNDVNINPSTGVADLAIAKSSTPAAPVPGETITYTLTASNLGPSRVVGATVLDLLPSSLSAPTADCSAVLPDACEASVAGNEVTATMTLAPGASVDIVVTATIDPAAVGTLTNEASISPPPGVTDPDSANDAAVDSTELAPIADLRIAKSPTANAVLVADEMQWIVTVTNDGPSRATAIEVIDTLPPGVTLVAEPDTCTAGSCSLAAIDPGDQVQLVFTGRVEPTAADEIVNTVAVTSEVTDPDLSDNEAVADAVQVVPVTDLAVAKTSSPDPAVAGAPLVYRILVSNTGPSDSFGATLTDELPSELASADARCEVVPAAGACDVDVTGSIVDGTFDIPAGESVVLIVDAVVDPDYDGSIENVVDVAPGPGAVDPNLGDNQAIDRNPSVGEADLVLEKELLTPSPEFGGPVSWRIEVTNLGPTTAIGSRVLDQLPASVDDATWTCEVTAGAGACGVTEGIGNVDVLVDLAVGSTAVVLVDATVVRSGASLDNSAQVEAASGYRDPNPDNNEAAVSASVPVRPEFNGPRPTTPVDPGAPGATAPAPGSVPAVIVEPEPQTTPLATTGRDSSSLAVSAMLLIIGGASLVAGSRRRYKAISARL